MNKILISMTRFSNLKETNRKKSMIDSANNLTKFLLLLDEHKNPLYSSSIYSFLTFNSVRKSDDNRLSGILLNSNYNFNNFLELNNNSVSIKEYTESSNDYEIIKSDIMPGGFSRKVDYYFGVSNFSYNPILFNKKDNESNNIEDLEITKNIRKQIEKSQQDMYIEDYWRIYDDNDESSDYTVYEELIERMNEEEKIKKNKEKKERKKKSSNGGGKNKLSSSSHEFDDDGELFDDESLIPNASKSSFFYKNFTDLLPISSESYDIDNVDYQEDIDLLNLEIDYDDDDFFYNYFVSIDSENIENSFVFTIDDFNHLSFLEDTDLSSKVSIFLNDSFKKTFCDLIQVEDFYNTLFDEQDSTSFSNFHKLNYENLISVFSLLPLTFLDFNYNKERLVILQNIVQSLDLLGPSYFFKLEDFNFVSEINNQYISILFFYDLISTTKLLVYLDKENLLTFINYLINNFNDDFFHSISGINYNLLNSDVVFGVHVYINNTFFDIVKNDLVLEDLLNGLLVKYQTDLFDLTVDNRGLVFDIFKIFASKVSNLLEFETLIKTL